MKTALPILVVLLMACIGQAYAQDNKTLVKTFDPEDKQAVVLQFKHKELAGDTWEKASIRFELEIHANVPEAILGQLVKAGRYSLSAHTEDNNLIITAPNLEKSVTIGGVDLEEKILISAKYPEHYITKENYITKNDDIILSLLDDGAARGSKAFLQLKEIKEEVNVEIKFVSTYKEGTAEEMNADIPPGSANPTEGSNKTINKKRRDRQGGFNMVGDKATSEKYGDVLIDGEPLDME